MTMIYTPCTGVQSVPQCPSDTFSGSSAKSAINLEFSLTRPSSERMVALWQPFSWSTTISKSPRCSGSSCTANSGQEGLLKLDAAALPNIILLDVDMPPGMSGPEMAHQMLVHDAGQENIPVILMSGNEELPQIAKRMGTPYWLTKHGDSDALLKMISCALSERVAPASACTRSVQKRIGVIASPLFFEHYGITAPIPVVSNRPSRRFCQPPSNSSSPCSLRR